MDVLLEFDALSLEHNAQAKALKRAALKAKRDVEDAELDDTASVSIAQLRSGAEQAARAVRQVCVAHLVAARKGLGAHLAMRLPEGADHLRTLVRAGLHRAATRARDPVARILGGQDGR